jgi:hypothetical protein
MEVEIFNKTSPLFNEVKGNHRGGVWYCPFCHNRGAESLTRHDEHGIFHKKPYLLQIILNSDIYYHKGHGIAISECPYCKEVSWVHTSFEKMRNLAHKGVIDFAPVQAEIDRLEAKTKEEWLASLCQRCECLTELQTDRYGFWRDCNIGFGPPKKKCKSYEYSGRVLKIDWENWEESIVDGCVHEMV